MASLITMVARARSALNDCDLAENSPPIKALPTCAVVGLRLAGGCGPLEPNGSRWAQIIPTA
ncbi:hypothetical protein [Paracoccus sp. (in: a-proteobacteria)]|uniref:hypothetical protein n=1 Tax=Paracoccus sp. TaxID=267 RepID=UPI0026E08C64|nr:hypothetical protein [Paracoccus sp. (in: a-proteobacteria)]